MIAESNSFFLKYQTDWILDNSRLKILEKSRQIGMTLATAYGAVRRHVAKQNTYDTWVSSRDELQAKLFIDDCKKVMKILLPACDFFDAGPEEDKPATQASSLSVTLSDGRAIHSLSSSVNAQAGKRGTRILDEFALHPEQKNLFTVSLPGITWGGQLEILSTHRGSNNFFNHLICEVRDGGNPKNFSYHRVTLQDALEQGFLGKLQARLPESDVRRDMSEEEYFDFIRASCPDDASFLQEYMCVPTDDGQAFLTSDMINNCEFSSEESKIWELTNFTTGIGEYFLGIDIGRTHDLTVFWLLENQNDCLITKKILCLKNLPFSQQEEELRKFFCLKHLMRICIDQTGIGRQFFERAQEAFGQYRVEGVTFTNKVKEQLAYQLREIFENQQIRIPSDEFIRADLRSVRRETTFAGNCRFAGERTSGGHADRFWALALAIHAANIARNTPVLYLEKIERRNGKFS